MFRPRILATVLALAFLWAGGLGAGCVVHEYDRHGHRTTTVAAPLVVVDSHRCRPNHYWNGHRCVHKRHRGHGHHH